MAKRRLLVAIVAVVLGSLTATGAALAEEAQPQRDRGDHRAFCERLQSKAEQLRAAIGRLEAMSDAIKGKIASGELTEEQMVRARHVLAQIEREQAELKAKLQRLLEIYGARCRR